MQYKVPAGSDFGTLAKTMGINEQMLRDLNPSSGELVGGQVINLPYQSPFEGYLDYDDQAVRQLDKMRMADAGLADATAQAMREYMEPQAIQPAEDIVAASATDIADQLQADTTTTGYVVTPEKPQAEDGNVTPIQPTEANREAIDQLDTQGVAQDGREMFLNYMAEVEGTETHQGAEGGDDALTYGYGLKESTRNALGIEKSDDARAMAGAAYDKFYQTAKDKIPGLDEMDAGAQTFATSAVWNTGDVWGSVKGLAEAEEFDVDKAGRWLSNMKTSGRNLPGLGNRRAKDYNVLAGARGWPTITEANYTGDNATFTFSDGTTKSIDKKLEPTKTPNVKF